MPMEFSGMRVTPITVGAGIGVTTELDISNIKSIVVAEMTRWGTSVGDVSICIGDMGDFIDPSPGDGYHNFFPVRRLIVRNNSATARKLVFVLHESGSFRLLNQPRGV